MRQALVLCAASTALLLLAVLWPQPGRPVLLVLPAGGMPAAAFMVEGWRIRAVTAAGPLDLVHAMPESPSSDPSRLRAATGAVLAMAARAGAGCSPSTDKVS